jgi:endonuclease/exonuclease/phosphatase (EEP) superfamily protein YafD
VSEYGDDGQDGSSPHPSPYGTPPGGRAVPKVSPYAQPPSGSYGTGGQDASAYAEFATPVPGPPFATYQPAPDPVPPPGSPATPMPPVTGEPFLTPPGALTPPGTPMPPVTAHPPSDGPGSTVIDVVGLPILAVLLLGWSLTTLVGDVSWGALSVALPFLASFAPLVTVAAVAAVAMGLRHRNWVAVVPAVAAGGLPWIFVVGYVVPATPPTGERVPLRALLVTAHHGAAVARDIAAAARAQRADLVVVAEASSALVHDLTTEGLARSLSPRYVAVPEDGGAPQTGLAIYSRFTVDDVRPLPGTFWPAVRARVLAGGTPVTLIAGHAVEPSADHLDRWRSDLRVFATARQVKGPVLVLADLSATPWQAQFRALVSGRLHDAGDILGRGLRPTWPNASPVAILPTVHALVAGAGVSALTTISIGGTDERALSVELQVPRHPPH